MSYNLDKTSAKILVLGDSGVGKSSLIYLICHSTVLNSAQWTIGCSIDVKLHDNHFLEFWDIGGSRSHRIARSFLYQDYHGIILVFDATNNKSRSNLKDWLIEVTQKTNDRDLEIYPNVNVPTLTIATKKDLLPYGSVIDTNYTNKHRDEHSSVVDFNESPTSNQPYRRLQSSASYSISPVLSSLQSLSLTSSSSSSSSTELPFNSSSQYENPLDNEVIQVNTQDVLSFSPGSRNCEKLNSFFKRVIGRRNKFAI